jgi:predicted transcriptional regulator YdeE
LDEIEYIKIDECKFIGVAIRQNIHGNNDVPGFWEELKNNGTLHLLESVQEKVFKNAIMGWMGNYDDKTKEFDYCIGILTKSQDVQGVDQD